MFNFYEKLPHCFPKWLCPVTFPTSSLRVLLALHPHQHLVLSVLWWVCDPGWSLNKRNPTWPAAFSSHRWWAHLTEKLLSDLTCPKIRHLHHPKVGRSSSPVISKQEVTMWYHMVFFFFFFKQFRLFSGCGEWKLLSSCSVQASHCGDLSCCRAWVMGQVSLVAAAPRL